MNARLIPWLEARWNGYAARIAGGLVVSALLMIGGAVLERFALLPVGAALVVVIAWFYAASTWVMSRETAFGTVADVVWVLIEVPAQARFVHIDVGIRNSAIALSRKLQRGTLKIIDVFHPQWMSDAVLARTRLAARKLNELPYDDPRTIWLEGEIGRIPQRDNSVPAVVIDRALSAMVHSGDRAKLLNEVYRILEPGGRLVLVERVRRPEMVWLLGLERVTVSAETWQSELSAAGFRSAETERINGLLQAFRVVKPLPQGGQLRFNF